jgi:hypothetical protein
MDHSREIRQLWFFANSYFEEAKELKIRNCGHLDIILTAIMDFYKNGIPTEILNGHETGNGGTAKGIPKATHYSLTL